MIFFKQYLIMLTFIVISVWVMPTATEPDLEQLKSKELFIGLQ